MPSYAVTQGKEEASVVHIAVCIKQIIDPEIPPRSFAVDRDNKEAVRGSASLVIGPFDLNAMEVAVQLKERHGGKITVISVGTDETKEALKRALAMGGDEAVLVQRPEGVSSQPAAIAGLLAAALRKLDAVDLVLCGRQDGDWDFGQVGALLAEELGMPFIPAAPRLQAEGDGWRVEREFEGGRAVVEAPRPSVVSITNASDNVPRLPKVRDIMMAGRKPMHVWSAADLGVDGDAVTALAGRLNVVDLYIPEVKRECEFIEGDDGAEKGAALARRLLELKRI